MKKILNSVKGWKTVLINAVVVIVPILELREWVYIIPAEFFPHYIIAVAVLNVWLRCITNTKVGAKK